MRIFQTFREMLSEVGRDLVELGVTIPSDSVQGWEVKGNLGFEMKEITGYAYRLSHQAVDTPGFKELLTSDEAGWIQDESQSRVDSEWINPGVAWRWRRSLWEPMLVNGRFDYTYNERIRTQLPRLVAELSRNPHSRQAVLLIYQEQDQRGWGGRFRVPCSLSYQFIIRGAAMHLIYSMRSCDYFNHFKFDVILAMCLLWDVRDRVNKNLQIGTLTHFIGSLHCFRRDWEKAKIF